MTQEELVEVPDDIVAAHLLHLAQNFTVSSKNFYAFYLLSHGVVKIAFGDRPAEKSAVVLFDIARLILGLLITGVSTRHRRGSFSLRCWMVVMGLVWHELSTRLTPD